MAKFKGDILACVDNYGQWLRENYDYRNTIAMVLEVSSLTIGRWFDKLVMPKGLNLLKLQLLLELSGYETTECQRINPKIHELAKLVALGVLTLEEAAKLIGVSDGYSLSRILSGKYGTSSKKMALVESAIERFSEVGKRKLQEWKTALMLIDDKEIKTQTEEPKDALDHKAGLEILTYQIKAMIPLVKWIASNEFNPEERRNLRELSANDRSNNVFELSNLLNRLCSETARKETL